jgi:hypothetical protein
MKSRDIICGYNKLNNENYLKAVLKHIICSVYRVTSSDFDFYCLDKMVVMLRLSYLAFLSFVVHVLWPISAWCINRVVVFNATFNNISVISWWSVLLVEETGVPRRNGPVASH